MSGIASFPRMSRLVLGLACELDRCGYFKEADWLEASLKKSAYLPYQSPKDTATSIKTILSHLMMRVKPEKQQEYLQKMRIRLSRMSPLELASKKQNPSSAVGTAVSIVKNLLMGQHPSVIAAILGDLQRSL